MNALDLLFEINAREGKITKYLIKELESLRKLHGVVNTWKRVEPSYTFKNVRELHQRIKDDRRAISSCLQILRMDKKYG